MKGDEIDPKALIREAYRMAHVGDAECRSILMDWALSLPEGQDQGAALRALLARHGAGAPDHPMTPLLQEGLARIASTGRRGGWRGRRAKP
ncbi:hypothetical protein [Pseudooceanicola sp. 200-1SW]|uniref:hypothetical protein n=1 Tax=Pseudooceanicola sp. 200-1SW TaxID=3425949 RepID=UPI003D7FEF4F